MSSIACAFCGFIPARGPGHVGHHNRFAQACLRLRYVPATYERREQVKEESWPVVHDDAALLADRVDAAEAILRAWFDRSLEAAIHGSY
ncbi:MAG: hypothetical protein AB1609_21580 [Bacillota bacterium]